MSIMYAYFLGLWLIGPFDTLEGCQKARDWQLKWGTHEEVTECWTVVHTHHGEEHGRQAEAEVHR